jgi:alanine-synthesizing transaminase
LVCEALDRLELVCDTYLSVATPTQFAVPELLERATAVRRQIASRIVANHRRLDELIAMVPSCRLLHADAGWSAVVEVPTFRPEEELVVDLVTKEGVLVHPGYFFDFARESYLIVSLLPQEEIFSEGMERILRHFNCTVAPPD